MNEKKLKYAVIGVGNMGQNHVRICSEMADVNLAAVADLNENLAADLSKQYNCRHYTNYLEMIEKEKPDVVSICVPTAFHYEVAKECVNRNTHILLEKPIALRINEAEELLQLAKDKKTKLLVGHIERFNPAVRKVKELIEKGELGKVIAITLRRVGGFPPQIKDANIAADLAIHDIDITNYLLDELPREISFNKQKNHIEQREDSVEFFLKYKKTSAYIQANWITPVKIRKLNIVGSEGYLEMDFINQQIEFYKSNYEKIKESTKDFSDYILHYSEPDKYVISVAKKEPLKEEILYFIDCVKNNKEVDSQFAVEALRIALF